MTITPFPTPGTFNWASELEAAIESRIDANTAAGRILALARRDGWHAVYDPTNLKTVTIVDGEVTRLGDGLGNEDDVIVTNTGQEPTLVEGEFGQLNGLDVTGSKRMVRVFSAPIPDPSLIMVVARWAGDPTIAGGDHRMIDGAAGGRKSIIVKTGASGGRLTFGAGGDGEYLLDGAPHVFTYHAGTHVEDILIDGQWATTRNSGVGDTQLNGLAIGNTPGGSQHWDGTIGPVLVYPGQPSAEKINRMQNLLLSLIGTTKGPTTLGAGTVAYSVTAAGRVTFSHGDVDGVHPSSIQSVTKLMTMLVARDHITPAQMSNTVTVEASDEVGNTPIHAGDTLSWEALFALSLKPSFNSPNEVIARVVGGMISGTGSPREKFIAAMNQKAADFGYPGTDPFTSPSTGGMLSARSTTDLLIRAATDPVIGQLMGLGSTSYPVGGPNPRTVTANHSVVSGTPFHLPEVTAAKTGGGSGIANLTVAWTNPSDGLTHYTVILNVPLDEAVRRYFELKKIMVATSTGGTNPALDPGWRGV